MSKTKKKHQIGETKEKKKRSKGYSRRKGHSFERDIAIALRPVFPDARRHLEYHEADANGVDLINTGRYRIQCKRYKDYVPLNRIEEIQCDEMIEGHCPVLITQGDRNRVLVALPFEEFIRLLKRADDTRSNP